MAGWSVGRWVGDELKVAEWVPFFLGLRFLQSLEPGSWSLTLSLTNDCFIPAYFLLRKIHKELCQEGWIKFRHTEREGNGVSEKIKHKQRYTEKKHTHHSETVWIPIRIE